MAGEFQLHKHMRNVEGALRRCQIDPELCEANRAIILTFAKERLARGIGRIRVSKLLYSLRYLAHWLKKPFAEATKADLIQLIGELENKPQYSEHTKHDFKAILKLFYKWLKGNDEIYPPEISWLKSRLRNAAHKLPEELLTEDEVMMMAQKADQPRDRAFLLVLYETGCRIGEILSLKMKNVSFDQYGAILRVNGKTGDRRVRIISSAPALSAWIQCHIKANDPECALWPPLANAVKFRSTPMDHQAVYHKLKELAAMAGIRKRVYPHLFRHSRATALAGKLTEAQMKEYFGWTQGSSMAAVYVHMSGRDVDNALLALQGMAKPEEKREEKFVLHTCPRCQEKNSPAFKFCTRCGSPMDLTGLIQADNTRKSGDDVMNTLMQNPEFKEFLLKKVAEMGLEKKLTA